MSPSSLRVYAALTIKMFAALLCAAQRSHCLRRPAARLSLCSSSFCANRHRRHVLTGVLLFGLIGILALLMRHPSRHNWPLDIEFTETVSSEDGQVCVHPKLPLWHPSLREVYSKPEPFPCAKQEENWVTVKDGVFQIVQSAVGRHGRIKCKYVPVLWGKDDLSVGRDEPVSMRHGDKLTSDFFEVRCSAADGTTYANIHSAIMRNPDAVKRSATKRRPNNSVDDLDVIIVGFDTVSRMSWLRNMPNAHKYFTETLGGFVLEGYNIVGDGTTQALLAMLTGQTETELPESRRGFNGAKTIDDFPWIWHRLHDAGYVTQFGEDFPEYGSFQYRLLGFSRQPVDHYMRPFYIAADKSRLRSKYCFGSVATHINLLNWTSAFLNTYRTQPKFSFVFHAEYSHDTFNLLQLVDDDLNNFLRDLHNNGHLDRALLVLVSDHGPRFARSRSTKLGKYEERMPYIGLRFPTKFLSQRPTALHNLHVNVRRLTTPFDVHATLIDAIVRTTTVNSGIGNRRGISLLREIPLERTCADAGIEPHWCACMSWNAAAVNDDNVLGAAQQVIATINQLTLTMRNVCVELTLDAVQSASTYALSNQMLRFRKSLDLHGRVPHIVPGEPTTAVKIYQVTVLVRPSGAVYEATVSHSGGVPGQYTLGMSSISRTNKYGQQPHCIIDNYPHLRQFCYCIEQPPIQ